VADSFIVTQTVTPPGTNLDTESFISGGNTLHRERIQVTGAVLLEIARVQNSVVARTEYALVTRNIPEVATAGDPAGITVSMVAVLVAAANAARKSIIISNNSVASNMFFGSTAAVTTSGVTMGIRIAPGGMYTDSGDGLYTGDIYAIGSVAAAAPNASRWERT